MIHDTGDAGFHGDEDHDPLCCGLCCLAKSGPIRDEEPPRLEELYRDHGGEAGSA